VEPSGAPWRVLEAAEPEPSTEVEPERRGPSWLVIGVVALAVTMAGAAILLTARQEPAIGVDGAVGLDVGSAGQGGTRPPDPMSPGWLVVDVDGAVARPGVYRLAPGARVADAIAAAGGYGASVDVERADRQLNLAAPVADGTEIHVPTRGEAETADPGGDTTPGAPALVNLNTATADELDTLPGVGPATAAKIIAARDAGPFTSVDDLLSRKAVGAATLEKLRGLVTVGQ
jgi:competence protein ComEA